MLRPNFAEELKKYVDDNNAMIDRVNGEFKKLCDMYYHQSLKDSEEIAALTKKVEAQEKTLQAVWDRSCETHNGAMDKKTLLRVYKVLHGEEYSNILRTKQALADTGVTHD